MRGDRPLRDDVRDKAHHVSRECLVLKHVDGFAVQLFGDVVDSFDLTSLLRRAFPKNSPNRVGDELITIRGNCVDLRNEVVGKGYMNGHDSLD